MNYPADKISSQGGITECKWNGRNCLFIRGVKTNYITTKLHNDSDIQILIIQQSEIFQLTQQLERFKSTQILILNHMSISVLPVCICFFNHLTLLDISNNLLENLPQDIVYLTSLTVLNISKNCLTDVTVVCGLSHLQSLDVTENKLTGLPQSLCKLGELRIFSCSFNEIPCLPEEIGSLKSLTTLRVINNKLSAIPRSFSNLTSLLLLQLDGNSLDHIPFPIFSCVFLLELSLSQNIIEGCVPTKICSLIYLRTLNLAHNRITKFPIELGQLTSLEYFNISGNPLESSTVSFGKIIGIQEFSASRCGLSTAPSDLSLCPNLVILDLSENRIRRLHNENLSFPQLTSLCLANNNISTLPISICELKNLTVLELKFNELRSLPEDLGRLSYTLRQLDLGHNRLEVIPASLFPKMCRLSYLCLDSNPIFEVPDEISNLKELTHLSISGCSRLVSLPEGLGFCMNLLMLKASKNKLSSLPKTIAKLERLKYLDLSDNDFDHFPLVVCFIPKLCVLLYNQREGKPLQSLESPKGWYQKSLVLYPHINNSYDQKYGGHFNEDIKMISLEEVLLKTPNIEGLPPLIEKLSHLVYLSLQSNGLYALPDVFHRMKLQQLDVSHNRLHFLPSNFYKCKCLTHLYLHNNNIHQLDHNFLNLRTLRTLTLSQNPLLFPPVEVSSDRVLPVYSYLEQYKTLDEFMMKSLCKILITDIPKGSTHSLLRKIGFSNSVIESLEKHVPGGHNHTKRMKLALESWTGLSFEFEDVKSNEPNSDQRPARSEYFNSLDILTESTENLVVQNETPQSELFDKEDSSNLINKMLRESATDSDISSHKLLHIVHLIGLDELHSKLMKCVLNVQQVRF
ncbi:hypothetical protein MN116_003644 [Schistosoma mekongi]|uniref:Leucine-rich repeat and death domain-containing protein n=1 Tax=Schistosoma mekongi TaxID=38744 RepID=A0AAE1ZDN8_SCHME|nr:hypothetical protein MN116_003644 [Schistosoma mekongi]